MCYPITAKTATYYSKDLKFLINTIKNSKKEDGRKCYLEVEPYYQALLIKGCNKLENIEKIFNKYKFDSRRKSLFYDILVEYNFFNKLKNHVKGKFNEVHRNILWNYMLIQPNIIKSINEIITNHCSWVSNSKDFIKDIEDIKEKIEKNIKS
ncbi:hypothetical protein M9Y10_045478 [Tritrichomonas musculus]|uniref:Uncharacterized protein n=1 Tax=Tritrichomonas musculus TaxID=1915356 RepID=A0ABR2JVI9_9EUKA